MTPYYEIRLQGHLDARRAESFTGMRVALLPNGETRLVGPIADQAALYGILDRIRDMGVPLLAVNRLAAAGGEDSDHMLASRERINEGDEDEPTQ